FANAFEDLRVPAWLDFHLDAPVPCGDLTLDFFEQIFDGVLDANRDAAGDFVERAADQPRQRQALAPGLEVPASVFERRLGHVVAADRPEALGQCRRGFPLTLERPGKQKITQAV